MENFFSFCAVLPEATILYVFVYIFKNATKGFWTFEEKMQQRVSEPNFFPAFFLEKQVGTSPTKIDNPWVE